MVVHIAVDHGDFDRIEKQGVQEMVEKYKEQYDSWIYGNNKRHTELLKMMEKEETWCKLPFTRES